MEKQIELKGYISPYKTLAEQYNEVAKYVKNKLEKDINSTSIRTYILDQIELKGYIKTKK